MRHEASACTAWPDAPALVDEAGRTWRWREVAALRPEVGMTGPACVLQQATSGWLVRALWALRGTGTVPVLVHPREPAARRDALASPVVAGLASLSEAVRAGLVDVIFTSGSTGTPQAVAHDEDGWQASAAGSNAALPFGPGDRWLLSLPLGHVSGLGVLERARLGGGCVVIPRSGETLARALVDHGITHLSVVRAQLADLLETQEGREALAGLKAVIVGGGPTPTRLLSEALAAGVPLRQTWGMTETCAMVTLTAPGAPETCGRPLPGRLVRVTVDGLIAVGGGGLAAGLVGADGLTPLPRDADGLFVTRDLGALEPTGALMMRGRADSVFVSGGEKVRPEEVEAALLAQPGVREALVVPVPHPRWGMRPVAFVAATATKDELEGLRDRLRSQLPTWAVPDALLPWPHDVVGKPSRALLAERAAALLDAAATG